MAFVCSTFPLYSLEFAELGTEKATFASSCKCLSKLNSALNLLMVFSLQPAVATNCRSLLPPEKKKIIIKKKGGFFF